MCYDTGRRYFSRNFILFAAPRSDGEPPRLGVAVSRKVGSAVRRNRVKRLVREWFRQHGRDMARFTGGMQTDGAEEQEESASLKPQNMPDAPETAATEHMADLVLDMVVVAKRGIDVGALDFESVAQELSKSVRKVLKDLAGRGRTRQQPDRLQ